jgi:hypothetical protein
MLGGENQRPLRSEGERDDRRALGSRRVEDRQRVGRELALGVRRRL